MNKDEMVQYMLGGMKRRVRDVALGYIYKWDEWGSQIVREGGTNAGLIICGESWMVYEVVGELRKFSYQEVVWVLNSKGNNIFGKAIKSCVSGLSWFREPSAMGKEEFFGEWTIAGIFEEVLEDEVF